MTYYEYNDFMATAILNLFPFDEAVEFIQVRNLPCKDWVLQSSSTHWCIWCQDRSNYLFEPAC